MSKIGLLTGTFDPVHLGHIELAKAVQRAARLDEVWFLVNVHAEESESYKKGAVSPSDRLNMVRIATSLDPALLLYEGSLADQPHTMQTFQEVMQEFPGTEFVFVTGMDTIARLDRWEDFDSVVKNASFAVAHRPGTSQALSDLRERLGDLSDELKLMVFEFENFGAASSTAIRQEIRAGREPKYLDPRVFEYIKQGKLYQ
jgi:nicotinate-nucleotide adenylyltransferase